MKVLVALYFICAAPTLFAAQYAIDSGASSMRWVGKKVSGQHDGTVTVKSGRVAIEKGVPQAGEFTIDMNSITVSDIKNPKYNAKLVGHLKSDDFFNVKKHPTAKLKLTKATPKGKKGQYTFKGDLTVKGITHPISFPGKVDVKGKVATATAAFKINRTKWNIKYNSGKFFDINKLGDKLIYDDIEFELKLVARAK